MMFYGYAQVQFETWSIGRFEGETLEQRIKDFEQATNFVVLSACYTGWSEPSGKEHYNVLLVDKSSDLAPSRAEWALHEASVWHNLYTWQVEDALLNLASLRCGGEYASVAEAVWALARGGWVELRLEFNQRVALVYWLGEAVHRFAVPDGGIPDGVPHTVVTPRPLDAAAAVYAALIGGITPQNLRALVKAGARVRANAAFEERRIIVEEDGKTYTYVLPSPIV